VTLSQKQSVILIDGSSYLYRAFHALPPLSNMKGEPTGAIYGVISMIKKLLTEYDPDYMAVVFDPKGETQRDSIYSEYKANRPPMPNDLVTQIKPIFEIIEALGLPIVIEEGIEADDVIGTLAWQATERGMTTLISTGDKDMAQLVNKSVTLINTMTGTLLDGEGVVKKFGIPAEQIVDYLTLIGDKVDNIPGVPHVGPKTAVKWLSDYGSLEAILAHSKEIKGKVGEKLREVIHILPFYKQLVTISTNLELGEKVTDLARIEPDRVRLINYYKDLEFKSWLSELLENQPTNTHGHYPVIYDLDDLLAWVDRLKKCPIYALTIETTHSDAMRAELVGIAFAALDNEAIYIPLAHDDALAPKQLRLKEVLTLFSAVLADENKCLVGENLKFIVNVLARYGIEIKNNLFDIKLESYIQNSASARHDKNTLALKYLGKRVLSYEDIAGKGRKQIACHNLAIEKLSQYSAESADVELKLHQVMWKNISQNPPLLKIFTDLEMPLVSVLARMEYKGVLIDTTMLQKQSVELEKKIQALEQETFEIVGHQFNLSSPKQLQTILYDKFQFPVLSKTPKGQPSTSEATLQELAEHYPLPKIILEHRSLSKLKTTYTDRLPMQVNSMTGRVHTSYNQAITATGRLSSTDPNLQNIPIRNKEGRRIRQAFIAPPHYKIISADYSQIELRIMAHLSKDPGLLTAFGNNRDIHVATAAEVFNISLDQVTLEQRRRAKAINFGLIYGMSAYGLSRQLGIDRNLAQQYMDRYFERYPRIKAYMEATRLLAHRQGYVETLWGRRLYLPEINAINLQRQRGAERAAINAPLQGTAAEIIKKAMINIDEWLQSSKYQTTMIMQVHDELIFEVPEGYVKEISDHIRQFMLNTIELDIPLAVDIGIGDNWDEAH
jgi:DNA polymerase I